MLHSADRRRGRRRRADARRLTLCIKVSDAEKARIVSLARLNHQDVATFVRAALSEAASDCSDDPVFREQA